jgi:hypothetical protein
VFKLNIEHTTKFQGGGERYSYTNSLTSALDGVGGQRHAPVALPPVKTRYPLYRRLGGAQGRSGRVQKISTPPGLYPRTAQPVAKCRTGKAEDAIGHGNTDMRRLTTGIRSEKCVVRRFLRCANVIECTYTHLDGIAY